MFGCVTVCLLPLANHTRNGTGNPRYQSTYKLTCTQVFNNVEHLDKIRGTHVQITASTANLAFHNNDYNEFLQTPGVQNF